MAEAFVQLEGKPVEPGSLQLRRSREILAAIKARRSYASLIECRAGDSSEIVVIDVEVERPQHPVHDVRRVERIAICFTELDDTWPEALVLRVDFPQVSHLMLREKELPRSLCLYDRPWVEVLQSWSGAGFVQRIRWWLAQTARGELHGRDQPLEPLMFSQGFELIVGSRFGLEGGPTSEIVRLTLVDGRKGRVIVAESDDKDTAGDTRSFLALSLQTPPRCHGIIHHTPKTLQELALLVDGDEFQLLDVLRRIFRELPDDIRRNTDQRRTLRPLLVIGLPKTRYLGGQVERVELKGFLCNESLEKVGVSIGAWVVHDNEIGQPLTIDDTLDGSDVKVIVVNVIRRPTRQQLATANGFVDRDSSHILAIGAGALGSQVAVNLARAGFGTWTIVDDDPFMPHNTARHVLVGGLTIGHNKALCVALYINTLADDEDHARGIPCDFLKPGDYQPILDERLASSELVLDMSASVSVARELGWRDLPCRATSLFLSPDGQDLVLLAEDDRRTLRLDELEMIYYTAVATETQLEGHLSSSEGTVRYGASCRDVSTQIAQSHVGVHAGIGAAAIIECFQSGVAIARIWRIDPNTMGVRAVDIPVEPFVRQEQNGWRVRVSPAVLGAVEALRNDRLPNETGGILIGNIDQERRCVYVCLALPSPPDSEEWPTMYIRGVTGLREARDSIAARTAGNLDYLGEWHSHPEGISTLPSADDVQVFKWIQDLVSPESRPPVMLICGDDGARIFVDRLEEFSAGSPRPALPPPRFAR